MRDREPAGKTGAPESGGAEEEFSYLDGVFDRLRGGAGRAVAAMLLVLYLLALFL